MYLKFISESDEYKIKSCWVGIIIQVRHSNPISFIIFAIQHHVKAILFLSWEITTKTDYTRITFNTLCETDYYKAFLFQVPTFNNKQVPLLKDLPVKKKILLQQSTVPIHKLGALFSPLLPHWKLFTSQSIT